MTQHRYLRGVNATDPLNCRPTLRCAHPEWQRVDKKARHPVDSGQVDTPARNSDSDRYVRGAAEPPERLEPNREEHTAQAHARPSREGSELTSEVVAEDRTPILVASRGPRDSERSRREGRSGGGVFEDGLPVYPPPREGGSEDHAHTSTARRGALGAPRAAAAEGSVQPGEEAHARPNL